jgi:Holliday junction resolvase RusA-like endonuclease
MIFTLKGKFQPYTRRTHQGRHSERAKAYHASQNEIGWQLKRQMAMHGWEMLAERTPLGVKGRIVMKSALHRPDLDNQAKALLDAAQGIVFKDDRWIDEAHWTRELGNEDITVLRIEVR